MKLSTLAQRSESNDNEVDPGVFAPQRQSIGTERKGLKRLCERQRPIELDDADELDFPHDPEELELLISSGARGINRLFRHWGINE